MLKNKFLVILLIVLAHITTHSTIQSKQILQPQPSFAPTSPKLRRAPAGTRAGRPTVHPNAQQSTTTQQRLSDFDFHAASVLPTFINQNGKKCLILSQEARGSDAGTYDDFGGKRDYIEPKNNQKKTLLQKKQPLSEKERHPVITAAREFHEEAILELSIGLSLPKTQEFIDLKQPNTEYIIAYGHNVTYITDFASYKDTFFDRFYNAFNTTTSSHSKEKDRLAVVEWDKLKTIINATPLNSGVVIDAHVLNPQNLTWNNEQITLRGFFVKKLRPFWMDNPYEQGMSNKIRFYSDTITPATQAQVQKPAMQQLSPQQQQSWISRFWNWIKS